MIRFLLLQLLMLFVQNSVSCEDQTACENHDLNINCNEGYLIKIMHADYGRKDTQTCGTPSNFDARKGCSAGKSKNVVSARCNKKRSCTINANNGEFGDPCKGVVKYLNVRHKCLMVKTEEVCENLYITMSCSKGRKINIEEAFYGRENNRICGNVQVNSLCSANTAMDRVKDRCNGKSDCTIKASNDEFGDPCNGIFKYMRISYTCDENC